MTTSELEQVIREYIKDYYNMEYIGKLWIEKLKPVGYSVKLGLDVPEKPLTLYALLEDDKFVDWIKKELRACLFHLRHYGQIKLQYPEEFVKDRSCGSCFKLR